MIDLQLIRPDDTGKYSPLLHKWLTTQKKKNPWYLQHVFQRHDRIDGGGFNEHWRSRELIIGHGEISKEGQIVGIGGRNISDIICGAHGVMSQFFYYSASFGLRDITAEFWAEYERIGRCAWDHNHTMHMTGDDSRWTYSTNGGQRTCNWCGRVFEVERRTIVEVRQRETWSEYCDSAPASFLHPMGSMGDEV